MTPSTYGGETDDVFFRLGTENEVSRNIWELIIEVPRNPKFVMPPTTGKFFYVDFEQFQKYGMHTVKAKIPQKTDSKEDDAAEVFKTYNLYITLDEGSFGLFNKKCPADNCLIDEPYD